MTPETYPYIFYNARWRGYLLFSIRIGLLIAIGYGFVTGTTDQSIILFLLLPATIFILLGWIVIADDKPTLQFGRDGIWTRKLGAVAWSDVLLKYRVVFNPKAGSIESLLILDRNSRRQLDWVLLTSIASPVELIKQQLASCKKARIL